MTAPRPKVDLVQVFCANFESPRDCTGPLARRRDVTWPEVRGMSPSDLMDARYSRCTLEIFNLVLSGEGAHLLGETLEYYARLPVRKVSNPRVIARALLGTDPPLAEGTLGEVERQVESDFEMWQKRAIAILHRPATHRW